MRRTVWFLLVVILLFAAAPGWTETPARTALIELRDGHVYVGAVVKADRATITVETAQGERTFQLDDVAQITFGKKAAGTAPQERPLDEEFADLIRTILQKAKQAMKELDLSRQKPEPSR